MYVIPIVPTYLSSHLSFWLTISLFYKSVSVFLQIIKNTYTVLPMFKYYSLGALHISTHLNL